MDEDDAVSFGEYLKALWHADRTRELLAQAERRATDFLLRAVVAEDELSKVLRTLRLVRGRFHPDRRRCMRHNDDFCPSCLAYLLGDLDAASPDLRPTAEPEKMP